MEQLSGWRLWLAPSVMVAVAGVGFAYLESRLSSFDRRLDTVGAEISGQRDRADRVLEMVANARQELSDLNADVKIMGNKVDRIAAKLEVALVPTAPDGTPRDQKGSEDGRAGEFAPVIDEGEQTPDFVPAD